VDEDEDVDRIEAELIEARGGPFDWLCYAIGFQQVGGITLALWVGGVCSACSEGEAAW